MRKGIQLWNPILFVLLLSTYTNSGAAIGTITEQINSPPSIQRQKTTLTGNKGTGVEMADEVKTAKGKVGITFADDTKVQVNENSKLVIDDFVYDPKNKGAGKLALNMASGTVRYASGAIAQNNPNRVSVNTPAATIAVRGTDFTATVDELGASTIILLPVCKYGWVDIERDCKTGIIDVITDAGKVTLDRPFQATKVDNRSSMPLKPVSIILSEDAINNLLIVSPPREITQAENDSKNKNIGYNFLDVDYLVFAGLINAIDIDDTYNVFWKDTLSTNILEQDFLVNVLDVVGAQLLKNPLDIPKNSLLPDWFAKSGVVPMVDPTTVTLYRDDGANIQSITVPRSQFTNIIQSQNNIDIFNRVNNTGTTNITLKQN